MSYFLSHKNNYPHNWQPPKGFLEEEDNDHNPNAYDEKLAEIAAKAQKPAKWLKRLKNAFIQAELARIQKEDQKQQIAEAIE